MLKKYFYNISSYKRKNINDVENLYGIAVLDISNVNLETFTREIMEESDMNPMEWVANLKAFNMV